MDNIEAYVKDYGGGLITFGGEDSYALGGYKDTSLEKDCLFIWIRGEKMKFLQ